MEDGWIVATLYFYPSPLIIVVNKTIRSRFNGEKLCIYSLPSVKKIIYIRN